MNTTKARSAKPGSSPAMSQTSPTRWGPAESLGASERFGAFNGVRHGGPHLRSAIDTIRAAGHAPAPSPDGSAGVPASRALPPPWRAEGGVVQESRRTSRSGRLESTLVPQGLRGGSPRLPGPNRDPVCASARADRAVDIAVRQTRTHRPADLVRPRIARGGSAAGDARQGRIGAARMYPTERTSTLAGPAAVVLTATL
jgi:hypothetical protein